MHVKGSASMTTEASPARGLVLRPRLAALDGEAKPLMRIDCAFFAMLLRRRRIVHAIDSIFF